AAFQTRVYVKTRRSADAAAIAGPVLAHALNADASRASSPSSRTPPPSRSLPVRRRPSASPGARPPCSLGAPYSFWLVAVLAATDYLAHALVTDVEAHVAHERANNARVT
ncbi:hypothetical protein OC834_007631, partial [Tilletia horrida]